MTARFTLDPPLASAELNNVPTTPTEMAAVTFVKEMAAHVDQKNGREPMRATQKKVAAIVRDKFFSPLASADTWAGRSTKFQAAADREWNLAQKAAARAREAQIEAIWHANKARRDKAAKAYGEPETPHEFYAGRPGSQAERIVLDCLRELQAIPEADRLYAHELTDAISAVYLDLAWRAPRQRDAAKIRRRTMALWKLFRIGMALENAKEHP